MASPNIFFQQRQSQVPTALDITAKKTRVEDLRSLAESRRQTVAENKLKLEAMERDTAENAELDAVWERHGGDFDAAFPDLMAINPNKALSLQTQVLDNRSKAQRALADELDGRRERLSFGRQLALSIKDEDTWKRAKHEALEADPELASLLGDAYDPARIEQVRVMGDEMGKEQEKSEQVLKDLLARKYHEAVGSQLSMAKTPEDWAEYLDGFRALGVPMDVLRMFPQEFSPDNAQLAARMTMTPAEEADEARQDEESRRRDRALTLDEQGMALRAREVGVREGQLDLQRQELREMRETGRIGDLFPSKTDRTAAYYHFLVQSWRDRNPDHKGDPPPDVREAMLKQARNMRAEDDTQATTANKGISRSQYNDAIKWRTEQLNDIEEWVDDNPRLLDEQDLIIEAERRRQSIEGDFSLMLGGLNVGQRGDIQLGGPSTVGSMMPQQAETSQAVPQDRTTSYIPPGHVLMEAPDGTQRAIPEDQVEYFMGKGAKVVE